jgi:hypothetical protein
MHPDAPDPNMSNSMMFRGGNSKQAEAYGTEFAEAEPD